MSHAATSRLKVNPQLGTLPVLQYCTPEQLQIDELYQRSLETGPSQTLIRKIASYWDWSLCQPLIVSRRPDGQHYVVDGQHRLAAARLRSDIFQLPCVVASYVSSADEAASFVALNQQRRPLSALDLFKAALMAGDQQAAAIHRAIEASGLHLSNHGSTRNMKDGHICNIGGLQRCYQRRGETTLATSLKVLARAFPNQLLRYAGTLFPGIAAVVADELRIRMPIAELVDQAGALFGEVSQVDWVLRVNAARAGEGGPNSRDAAAIAFRDYWRGRNERIAQNRTHIPPKTLLKPAEMAWCTQCDHRVSGAHAEKCTSPFCSLKVKAA